MKKNTLLTALTLFCVAVMHAQNSLPANGNIGAGTTTPIRAMHVNGELSVTRADKVGFINVSDPNGNGSGTLWLRGLDKNGSEGAAANVFVQGSFNASRDALGSCCSQNGYTLGVSEYTAQTGKKASIQFHNGGIDEGTIELSHDAGFRSIKFHDNQGQGLGIDVRGQAAFSRDGMGECCSPNKNFTVAISEYTSQTGKKASIQFHNAGIDEGTIELSHDAGFRSIKFHDNQGQGLGIDVSGKSVFKSDVQVNGSILTSRVKVAAPGGANWNWADYVFEDNYKLKPLLAVEAYIKENKHLEGMPTTEEVKKDGIDIAPVTAKLLEKIEELTLYVIEMKKENGEMKKIIESQNNKIQLLEIKINN